MKIERKQNFRVKPENIWDVVKKMWQPLLITLGGVCSGILKYQLGRITCSGKIFHSWKMPQWFIIYVQPIHIHAHELCKSCKNFSRQKKNLSEKGWSILFIEHNNYMSFYGWTHHFSECTKNTMKMICYFLVFLNYFVPVYCVCILKRIYLI